MKQKSTVKALVSLLLSVVLFIIFMDACGANRRSMSDVYAEDKSAQEGSTETETPTEDGTETEAPTEGGTETESETVSESETSEPECTCTDRCPQYYADKDCMVCKGDYKLCGYVNPNVKITIATPIMWHNDTMKVYVSVEDVVHSGNFAIKTVQAKISQNGSWADITEDMYVEISENAAVYVLVIDQKGKVYEKSRYIKCFDFAKPTLNAAVSDGMLSVQAHDVDSGIKAVYVNGQEFTGLTNGVLNIRLQQFDAGYQYFSICAMDNAGNMSDIYKTPNPYYTDPEKWGSNEKRPIEQLPANARATEPSPAVAQVTEHTGTDGEGNAVAVTPRRENNGEKEKEDSEDTKAQKNTASGRSTQTEVDGKSDTEEKVKKGKEFYTIQTASGKKFYIIIDRDGDGEKVYFLTEISENDLLNVTTGNSETLPKNSAVLDVAVPMAGGESHGGSVDREKEETPTEKETPETESTEGTEETELEKRAEKPAPVVTYIVMCALAVAFTGVLYYLEIVRTKKEEFLDEDEEEYEEDEEESGDAEDDFFEEKEGEE